VERSRIERALLEAGGKETPEVSRCPVHAFRRGVFRDLAPALIQPHPTEARAGALGAAEAVVPNA
jgi:hypothetical protein